MSSIYEGAARLAAALSIEGVRGIHGTIASGLAQEDALPEDAPRRHGFRKYGDFREQADAFEAELKARGATFTPIQW